MLLSLTTGCTGIVRPFVPPELPDDIAFVVANEELFVIGQDNPLDGVAPGTAIDDLGDLSGCWGVFVPASPISLPVVGDTALDAFDVFRFDIKGRRIVHTTFLRDVARTLFVAFVESGTYELLAMERVRFSFTDSLGNDPFTGMLIELPSTPDRTLTFFASTSGGWMSLRAEGDAGAGEAESAVYRRFECPGAQ